MITFWQKQLKYKTDSEKANLSGSLFSYREYFKGYIEELNIEEYFAILYLHQTADAVLRFNKEGMEAPADACSISLFLHLA